MFSLHQHVMKFAEMTQEVQIARPELVRPETGLAPGRRRMAEQYRKAVLEAQENGGDVPLPEPMIYSLGPPFPSLEVCIGWGCVCV